LVWWNLPSKSDFLHTIENSKIFAYIAKYLTINKENMFLYIFVVSVVASVLGFVITKDDSWLADKDGKYAKGRGASLAGFIAFIISILIAVL